MKPVLVSVLTAVLITATANAGIIKGILLNDDDPYIVKTTTGDLFKVEWYSGSGAFSEGDYVIITTDYGRGEMIFPVSEETAEVWVEEIDD